MLITVIIRITKINNYNINNNSSLVACVAFKDFKCNNNIIIIILIVVVTIFLRRFQPRD